MNRNQVVLAMGLIISYMWGYVTATFQHNNELTDIATNVGTYVTQQQAVTAGLDANMPAVANLAAKNAKAK